MATGWCAMSVAGCAVGVGVSSGPEPGERTVSVGADAPGGSGTGSGLDRSRVPTVGPPPSLDLPEIQDWTRPDGLRVVLVERHELPVVALEMQFRGGASAHPASQAGLAALTADMLDEGTPARSALEFSDAVDRLGASLVSTAGRDASEVHLSVLRNRFPAALDLVADIVARPTFPAGEFQRVKEERAARVLQRADQPASVADDAFARVLYGADHPYGVPILGTAASLSGLDLDDVRAFHDARYAPGQGTLVVVGDLVRDSLDAALDRSFAGWVGHGQDPPTFPAPPAARNERVVYLVDRPGSAQSEVRVGRVALARATDVYFPVMVGNTVLGGSFTSRLNAKLREEKGYTYGAYSFFDLRLAAGPFEAGAAVSTPATDSAALDFVREIDRLAAEPVPDAELARARNYMALRLPQRFETADDVVARLADLTLHGISLDFYEDYVERALAVAPADVRRVAASELDTRSMVVVVVGDRAVVEAPLRAAGIGPVEVLVPGNDP